MLKKIVFAVVVFVLSMGFAFAQVDVNKADQAALDGIKGIGPKMSKTILDERKKNGDFKDWADFQSRVKGVGEKNSVNLSKGGLTVNGTSKEGAPAASASAKADKLAKAPQAASTDSSVGSATKKAEKSAAKVPVSAASSSVAPAKK